MKCCICKKEIDVQPHGWAKGHNAEPVMTGRCCTSCNDTVVIPTRIATLVELRSRPKPSNDNGTS